MKTIFIVAIMLLLTGCASTQNAYYQAEAERHKAEGKKWDALKEIGSADKADATTRALSAVMIGMDGKGGNQQATMAPKSALDYFLQAVSIVAPSAVQVYSVRSQAQVGMRQSDNATALGISTNNAFVGIAGKIQAPAPNITTTTSTSLGGNGVIGSGTYTSNPISGSYNPVDNSQRNPVDNSNQGNPINNSNQNNPVTN